MCVPVPVEARRDLGAGKRASIPRGAGRPLKPGASLQTPSFLFAQAPIYF